METISIELPSIPSSLTKNGRRKSHWTTQQKDTRKLMSDAIFLIRYAIQEESPPSEPWTKAKIHIHQKWSNTPLDYDGLASGAAPIVDAFIHAGIIKDDSPKYICSYTMSEEKVPKQAQRAIVVTVSRADDSGIAVSLFDEMYRKGLIDS
jgi:hypothetical protein